MFHIVLNLNDDYAKYASVLISSIVKHTDTAKTFAEICKENHIFDAYPNIKTAYSKNEEGYVFHILSDFLSDETRNRLEDLKKKFGKVISL
ncbi:hypothetical protein HC278_001751 [Campylobacter jejuni]|nr:hypothetical protein [Campylobacter jejuni]